MGMACTSLSFVLGRDKVWSSLQAGQGGSEGGLLVTDMATSQLRAIKAVRGARIALFTPYIDDVHQRNVQFLSDNGIEVLRGHNLGCTIDEETNVVTYATITEEVRKLGNTVHE